MRNSQERGDLRQLVRGRHARMLKRRRKHRTRVGSRDRRWYIGPTGDAGGKANQRSANEEPQPTAPLPLEPLLI